MMPLYVKIYIVVFILFIVSNLGYLLYVRSKIRMLLYDLASGIYLAFLMVAYWNPKIMETMSTINIPIFIAVLGFEFYISTWGNLHELGITVSDFDEGDLETAKCISLIFSAPAYITGGLVCMEIARKLF